MKLGKSVPLVSILSIALVLSACKARVFTVPGQTPGGQVETQTLEPLEATKPVSVETDSPAAIQPTASPTPLPTLEVDIAALEDRHVSVRHAWLGTQAEAFDELVEAFNLENAWGVTVSATSGSGYAQLAQDLAAGVVTEDLVIAPSYDLLTIKDSAPLAVLNLYMADPDLGLADRYPAGSPFAEFAPNAQESLPRYTMPLAYEAGVLYYNQAWAEELGFTQVPLTAPDLETQLLAALAVNTSDEDWYNNGTGGLWLSKSPLSAQSWFAAAGGVFTADQTGLQLDRNRLEGSFSQLKEMFGRDASWIGMENFPYQYFADRYALAYEGTLADIVLQEGYLPVEPDLDQWISLPYPTEDGNGSLALEALSFAIQGDDPQTQLAAWLFGRWLLEPQQQTFLSEIHGLWPAAGNPAEIAPEYAALHPAWASALLPGTHYTLAPERKGWAVERLVFQDAFLRVYGLDAQYFPSITDLLLQTFAEIQAGSDE